MSAERKTEMQAPSVLPSSETSTIEIEVQSAPVVVGSTPVTRDTAALRVKVHSLQEAEYLLDRIGQMMRSGLFRGPDNPPEVRIVPQEKSRNIGDRIARIRARYLRWTQPELARRAGLVQSQVSEYETGRTQPQAATVARIARAFRLGRSSRRRIHETVSA